MPVEISVPGALYRDFAVMAAWFGQLDPQQLIEGALLDRLEDMRREQARREERAQKLHEEMRDFASA